MISGVKLREEREGAGVTAAAIARGMGVSRQYVSKVERYEFVTGDLLALYRGAIETELAKKEGREPMNVVPLACPICDEATEPPHATSLIRHLASKHREREGRVKPTIPGDRSGVIASASGRDGWLVDEGKAEFTVVFVDYPYSVMRIPAATYGFEPKNVVDTPEETK